VRHKPPGRGGTRSHFRQGGGRTAVSRPSDGLQSHFLTGGGGVGVQWFSASPPPCTVVCGAPPAGFIQHGCCCGRREGVCTLRCFGLSSTNWLQWVTHVVVSKTTAQDSMAGSKSNEHPTSVFRGCTWRAPRLLISQSGVCIAMCVHCCCCLTHGTIRYMLRLEVSASGPEGPSHRVVCTRVDSIMQLYDEAWVDSIMQLYDEAMHLHPCCYAVPGKLCSHTLQPCCWVAPVRAVCISPSHAMGRADSTQSGQECFCWVARCRNDDASDNLLFLLLLQGRAATERVR